jgi:hypothetical protein
MADEAAQPSEAEQRAIEALWAAVRAFEAIPDANERARATSKVLRVEWPKLHRLLADIRQGAVEVMHEQGQDFPEIGRVIGTDRSRAWRIWKGLR